MTGLTRAVTRQTSEIDSRTGKPLVIRLEQGGKLVRIKLKGDRTWYTIPMRSIHMLGARLRAEEIRQEKLARRKERQRQRKER